MDPATTGTSCRGSSRPALVVAVVLTTLALFVASFTTRRAYAAIGTLAVLFIGGAVGGIARGQLRRHALGGALRGRRPARARSTRCTGSSATRSNRRTRPGWVSALWLRGPDGRARGVAPAPDGADGARLSGAGEPTIALDRLSRWFGGVVAVSDVTLEVEPGRDGSARAERRRQDDAAAHDRRPDRAVRGHGSRLRRAGAREPRRSTAASATCPSTSRSTTSSPAASSSSCARGSSTWTTPRAAAGRAIATVDLAAAQDRPMAGYSRGMRQRMRLAATLVHDPPLLAARRAALGDRSGAAASPARRDPRTRRRGPHRARVLPHPRGGRGAGRQHPPDGRAASSPRAASRARSGSS